MVIRSSKPLTETNMTIKTITKLAVAITAVSFMSVAQALSINSAGVVGTIDPGTPSSPAAEIDYVNQLLSMGANSTVSFGGNTYQTGANDFNGVVSAPVHSDESGNATGSGAYTWVLAKYGNTDWVFNIAALGGDVPADMGKGGGLSHWAGFGGSTTVPDGGATVALLGVGLVGLGMMRRKLS
jgi:hypothetical protein